MAIRRSAKGEAANILGRLGVKASINDIVKKFNSTFGDIDLPELIMKKFYAAEQGPTEFLITYAARIEELFAQAVEVKALDPGQETILKSVFYQGLRQPLKQFGNLKFETIKDYDRFKIEMQKIESDLENSTKKEKDKESSAKCNLVTQKSSNMDEVKDLLKQMNEKIKTRSEARRSKINNSLYHSEEKEIIVDHATIEETIIEVNLTEEEADTDRQDQLLQDRLGRTPHLKARHSTATPVVKRAILQEIVRL